MYILILLSLNLSQVEASSCPGARIDACTTAFTNDYGQWDRFINPCVRHCPELSIVWHCSDYFNLFDDRLRCIQENKKCRSEDSRGLCNNAFINDEGRYFFRDFGFPCLNLCPERSEFEACGLGGAYKFSDMLRCLREKVHLRRSQAAQRAAESSRLPLPLPPVPPPYYDITPAEVDESVWVSEDFLRAHANRNLGNSQLQQQSSGPFEPPQHNAEAETEAERILQLKQSLQRLLDAVDILYKQ